MLKMSERFQSSCDHLLAEVERIELMLHLQVMRLRQESIPAGDDKFRGLYISEQEIDKIAGASYLHQRDSSARQDNSNLAPLTQALNQLEADIRWKEAGKSALWAYTSAA
jgi:hypothetical protein